MSSSPAAPGLPRIAAYPLPVEAELPPNRVAWRLAASRAALLVHDMQRYFVAAYPAEAAPMAQLVANVAALRDACDQAGVPVFYSAQRGGQPRETRGLQADFWGPGMRADPDDEAIVASLAPRAAHHVLPKWRYSAFRRTAFEDGLRTRGRDQLIVTGIYASIGCLLTAADAFMRDVEPFVVADAVADFSRARHDDALAYVAGRCGVVATTRQVLAALEAPGRTGAES